MTPNLCFKSIEKFQKIGLFGHRKNWRKQLEAYFWHDKER